MSWAFGPGPSVHAPGYRRTAIDGGLNLEPAFDSWDMSGASPSILHHEPPAGASLLFGALDDSGRIKERKNGSYRMVLKGVDEIDWFTDRPERADGSWKLQKLLRKWDKYFASGEPNVQATVEVGEDQ